MEINEIVQVDLTVQDRFVSRAGFGNILILGDSSVLTGTRQVQTLTFSATLVTSNTFDMDIDGVAITTVTFDTDNNTTLDAIATEIESNANVYRAVRTGTDTITITTEAYKEIVLTDPVVALGASQATVTVAETVQQLDEIRTYTSLAGVAEDFSTSSIEYKKANAIFAQSPRVQRVKVARRRSAVAQVITVTIGSVTVDTLYRVTLNGNPYSYTSQFGDAAADIIDGLVAAINAGSEPVTLADNTTNFTITADYAGESISIETTTNISYTNTTANQGMADDILRAKQVDNDFYFVVINTTLSLDIREAAKTVESLHKLFFAQTSDADVKNNVASNLAAVLAGKNYNRTVLCFVDDTTEHRDATYSAAGATSDPGSITWVFKSESGVTAPVLTATQETNLKANNVNYQVVVKNQTFSYIGKAVSGRNIDISRSMDYFAIRVQEDSLDLLLQNPKIPYNNSGIQMFKQIIDTRAEQCKDQGIFNSYETIVPDYTETESADRAARLLRVAFVGRLQGAIEHMIFTPNITV